MADSKKNNVPLSDQEPQQKVSGISRRDFLRNTGIAAGTVALGSLIPGAVSLKAEGSPTEEVKWDYEADVVVIGSGGAGLPAALKAREEGASVLVVDCNWDIGGHAATSGGNLHSGGGTSMQKKFGIEDSPSRYYLDHTTPLTFESRYNDRDVVFNTSQHMVDAYEFILENGVLLADRATGGTTSYLTGGTSPETVGRDTRTECATKGWVSYLNNEVPVDGGAYGIGLVRPLERSARDKGVDFLMNYRMVEIVREGNLKGRALGIVTHYTPTILPGETTPLKGMNDAENLKPDQEVVNIKANKGIVICTGGHTSNEKFRTIFDARLGPEFDGVAGDPFSFQDASGELAAMAIGGSLGTTANQTQVTGAHITRPNYIGCQYGYRNILWSEDSPIFPLVRAIGLNCRSYEDVILVNMLGQRFWNEDESTTADFFAAALGSVIINGDSEKDARRYAGPTWAIFDSETVKRREWVVEPPYVDKEDGRFFVADTLEELAEKVINKYYEDIKMDPKILAETVARYNSFVDSQKDEDFGKETLDHKIEKGPYYAAWATICLHDTLTGLRVTPDQQVMDIYAEPIPGLYCAGESAAGQKVHGFGRVITSGYIAGMNAAKG
jgi:succinate dehydrogenase/fumarate reductase flavoprotein subunit